MRLPLLSYVRQKFEGQRLDDVAGAVRGELRRAGLARRIRPGDTVAITAGSRGIANLPLIMRTIIDEVRACGGSPVLIPAMGSHGGGTADGQRRLLESYGLGEAAMGAPIRSSMETVLLGETDDGIPVHFDRITSEADRIIVVNRIKPHTSFAGEIESGLMKMMMIGLGNHAGAVIYHRAIVTHTFDRIVRTVGRLVRARCPITLGLAILENAYDQTAAVEAVEPEAFETRERELLVQARRWMPRLPLDEIDLLIVDEMGKNISGQGMDTNVTGRKVVRAPGMPTVTRLFVRALTDASHGNAHGIGQADFTTTRLVRAIDPRATRLNSITAGNPQGARVPIAFDTDREAIEAALSTIGLTDPERARIVRIRNTLKLEIVQVSERCRALLAGRDDMAEITAPAPFAFDAEGNLAPFAA
ncbi:MAG TPA: lactate racemase domain-containing protein [Vicinamibacterales bacterium]|nr:lactate racemase domain-containing protein [Vicinamibacterales bacterium]